MPRRRQAHFKADKLRQPEVLGGGAKSVRPRHDLVKYDGGNRGPNEQKTPWNDEEALSQSNRYSHKKFKKMEQASVEGVDPSGSSPGVRPSATNNLSLEALFQVTGHELEKIKLSSQDSDSSEQCATTLEGEEEEEEDEEEEDEEEEEEEEVEDRVRKKKKTKTKKRKTSEGRKSEAEDPEAASKRIRLGRHACPYCGLGCGKPSVLQKHIRAHTNERPYPCVPCGFSFKTKSNLYKHCKSRAHHLKVSDEVEMDVEKRRDGDSERCHGEDEPAIEAADRGEGETDGSSNSDEEVDGDERDKRRTTSSSGGNDRATAVGGAEGNVPSSPLTGFPARFSSAVEDDRNGGASAMMPTSIYKPKFHSGSYVVPGSCKNEAIEVGSRFDPLSKANSVDDALAVGSDGPDTGKGCINGVSGATSLAKRRNDRFQLRLEIPRPPPPPLASFPSCSSFSSSSSCSTSSRSASSPSVAASRPEPAINGDCLPVPVVVVSGIGHPSVIHCGEAISRTIKSPKLASPEYLQQHISKLISQNAAIVETLDPLWPRRYTRQNSVASSHNVDAELGGSKEHRFRRYSEDVALPALPSKSKLASALLASAGQPSTSEARDASRALSAGATSLAGGQAVKALQAMSLSEEVKDSAKEGDGGSIVRSLLLVDNAKRSKSDKRTTIDVPHPQNPEGSIIKDLLLKTRSAGHVRQTPSLATCMRLSGGSVSASSSASAVDGVRVDSLSLLGESLLPCGEHQPRDDAGGGGLALYLCSSCNISYKKADNLEAHRSLYCANGTGKVLATATSGGSFSVPSASKESRCAEDSASPDIVTCHGHTRAAGTGQEPSASAGELLCQKPRGRPRGSKNRPKMEAVPLGVSTISKVAPRTHSKSVSESGSEMLQTRDKTIDALKGKLCYRRNSVSGVGATESPRQVLVVGNTFDSAVADVDGEEKMTSVSSSEVMLESWRIEKSIDDGPILKKHLLGGDKISPLKKRKANEPDGVKSGGMATTVLSLKSLEHLSKYPMRPSAIHLFGGEVQICDGAETKKIVIDNKMSNLSSGNFLGGVRGSDSSTSSVVATIAKPVHNSGGTVLQVQNSKLSFVSKPVCIPVVSIGRPLMATGSENAQTSSAGNVVLPSPKSVAASQQFSIDISHLKLLNPSPILARSPSFDSSALPPVLLPFHVFSDGSIKNDDRMPSPAESAIHKDGARPETSRANIVPLIAIHSPKSPAVSSDVPLPSRCPPATTASETLLSPARPTTLALKKSANTSSVGMTLVSPETPRPEKKYGQCYHNGQYYTYLEFKQSTRVYYCNCRPQPMYVPQSVDPKLSMYSMWQTVPATPDPFGLSPPQAMSLYCSKPSSGVVYSVAKPTKTPLVLTHSSYWTFQQKSKDDSASPSQRDEEMAKTNEDVYCEVDEEEIESDVSSRKGLESEEDDNDRSREGMASREERSAAEGTSIVSDALFKGEPSLKHRLKDALEIGIHEPKRVKIFEGGFKSNEDYTYVRGRGRGKYVCEECGIRCKKPSMLKKHIRTHTDVRPYTCKHCNFSFKTKGNLTKHMKSKAHHKKCVELGIVPVPVTIDDAQIDEEALARQERIEHQRKQFADVDEDSALEEDEDEDDEDDEYYDQTHEEYKEGEDEDDESMELEGQFEDANEAPLNNRILTVEGIVRKGCPEQEIARSLLDLGKPEVAVGLPSPIPSSSHFDIRIVKEVAFLQRPTMSTTCHVLKRDGGSDEREELIGNPRVAWASCEQDVGSPLRGSDVAAQSNVYESSYDELMERAEEISVGSNSRERIVPTNPSVGNRNIADQALFIPQPDAFTVAKGTVDEGAYAPHSTERRSTNVDSTNDDCDQPIDLSMPHSRGDLPVWDNDEEEEGVDDEMDDDDDVDDEEDDEDEIVVDDDAGEKVGPFYCSFPEFEERRLSREADREQILSAGSPACQEKVAALPPRLQSPCQEEGSEGSRFGGNEWADKRATSPQCSMLHSYLSDQSPTKRMSIEVVATVSHHRASVSSSFGERDSSSVALPSLHATRTSLFGYSTSPPSQLDSLNEPSSTKPPPDRRSHLPSTSMHNMPQYIHRTLEDDKCICTICNKAFNKPSQLRLHVNIHYFERPFRCDSCAISFRTKGHLQKHKRSVSHYNKVNMNMTFGTPTTDNPRPFKCDDCKIAFRIHGHLAKHLRSKMHIMKLECLGKLPFGTYAEIERSGANLNEIDTTDCENSLESLQVMAHRLVDKVAVPQHWPRERTTSGGSCDDQSDGVPYAESPLPVPVLGSTGAVNCATNVPRQFGSGRSLSEDGCASPDLMDSDHLVSWSRKSFDGDIPALPPDALDVAAAPPSTVKREPSEKHQLPQLMSVRAKTVLTTVIRRQDDKQPGSGQRTRSVGSLIQEYEDISDEDASEMESGKRNAICFACRICGKSLKSAKFLQLHMYVDHADNAVATSEASANRTFESDAMSPTILHSSVKRRKTSSSPLLSISLATSTTIAGEGFGCQLCGERFASGHNLKQHMLIHAQFRPFVCGICDAGFTNSHYLKLHTLQSHQQGKSFTCQECNLVFGLSEDLKHHVDHSHPAMDGDRVR